MNVIITGATKGIGRAIAEKFASEGHQLAVCARSENSLLDMQSKFSSAYNIDLNIKECDVSKKEEVLAFGAFCAKQFKQIDILINNAGYFIPGDIHTEEEGMLEKMIETNLYSAYHLSRFIVPLMQKKQKGLIINISSVAGIQAYPQGGSYSISKYALTGFSQNLRNELKTDGIKVSTVYPGATYSDSWKGSGVDENRIMEASDIAKSVYALSQLSDKAVVEDIILRPQLGDL